MKIPIKIIYLIVAIIALIFMIYAFLPNGNSTENDTNQSNVDYNKLDEIIFNFKTDTVTKGTLVQKITANGIVRADKELDVSANISGVISEINIYDGKYVNKNDILKSKFICSVIKGVNFSYVDDTYYIKNLVEN